MHGRQTVNTKQGNEFPLTFNKAAYPDFVLEFVTLFLGTSVFCIILDIQHTPFR